MQVLYHLFMYVLATDPIKKERSVEIPLNGLNLPHFCACPKPGPRHHMSLKCEVIVRSVDIDRIVDHHCRNFLFIIVCSQNCNKRSPMGHRNSGLIRQVTS